MYHFQESRRRRFLVVSAIFAALTSGVAKPTFATEIFWASDPVAPGEAVLVIGEDFGPAPRVSIRRLDPKGATVAVVARSIKTVALLAHSHQSLAFELPADFAWGAFDVEVEGSGSKAQRRLNAPVVYWVQGDQGSSASPGGEIRLFGRSMCVVGAKARLVLRRETDGAETILEASGGDLWEARFPVPSEVGPGNYALGVDNGLVGEARRVPAGTMRIEALPPRAAVVDAKGFGVKGDGKADDTSALGAAIAAAGQSGGTVLLPPGRFRLTAGLMLPRHVTLAGAGRERTALMFDDFLAPPPALIAGTTHFGVRDLSIFASNHEHIIAGVGHERRDAEKGYVAIERIRVRAMYLRGHATVEDVARQYKRSLKFVDIATILLGGPNLRIVDCDLLGSGRSIGIYDPRDAVVSGNTLYNGRLGWYGFIGADRVIFENNRIIGADLMASGGGTAVHSGRPFSRNVIFRNNRFERFLGWDREAVTTDGGGGYIYGTATAVSANQVRVAGEINEEWSKSVPDWTGAGFFILSGRGRGQLARVAKLEGDLVTLDRPLAVPPDASSVISLTQLQQQELFIGNLFEDVGSAIQFYGTSVEFVAADNRAARSFGFLASGRWYRHYQPSWYNQFFDNEVRDANVYRSGPNGAFTGESGRIALWGLQKPPNRAPLLLGGILRGNRLRDGSYIELKGGNDPSAAGIRDVVIENNVVDPPGTIISDRGSRDVVVRPR